VKYERNMNDCIVIIPTYNEIENIESIIRAVSTQTISCTIDDNSDHTDKVRMLQKGI
jgi:dolichol-phosphate mannosyltransferase